MIVVIVGRGPWELVGAIIIITTTTKVQIAMASSKADLVVAILDLVMVTPLWSNEPPT